jgi:hypothetical protein
MALPRATVAMVAVDLHAKGSDGADARTLARALGAGDPAGFAGPALRAVLPDASRMAALFFIPARNGVGLNSGVVVETRDPRAALDAARRIRPLVNAERRARHGVVRSGTSLFRALDRVTASPTAAAAADRWVIWGDPRAVRAAVVAVNGVSLGETVPFVRAIEAFRDGTPALVYVDPRALTGPLVARSMGLPGPAGRALADKLLGVRFARPVGGSVRLARDHVTIESGTQDGCPAAPLADAAGGPADAALVAGLPLYGLAQRQCRPFPVNAVRVTLPRSGPLDLDRELGWLQPSRIAFRDGGVSIAARVRDPARARRELPRLRRALDRMPGVKATLTAGATTLDVSARGRPHVRLVVHPDRALIFVGPPPGASKAQASTTPAYRQAVRLLGGDHRLTALAIRPRRGVAFVAVGEPTSGAGNRGSGARVVIALR